MHKEVGRGLGRGMGIGDAGLLQRFWDMLAEWKGYMGGEGWATGYQGLGRPKVRLGRPPKGGL